VCELIGSFGDGVGDAVFAQVDTGGVVCVALIGQQPKPAAVGSSVGRDQRRQLGIVVGLPSGEPQRHRGAVVINQSVDLGGPAAARAAQRMIVGFSAGFRVIRPSPP